MEEENTPACLRFSLSQHDPPAGSIHLPSLPPSLPLLSSHPSPSPVRLLNVPAILFGSRSSPPPPLPPPNQRWEGERCRLLPLLGEHTGIYPPLRGARALTPACVHAGADPETSPCGGFTSGGSFRVLCRFSVASEKRKMLNQWCWDPSEAFLGSHSGATSFSASPHSPHSRHTAPRQQDEAESKLQLYPSDNGKVCGGDASENFGRNDKCPWGVGGGVGGVSKEARS